MGDDTIEDKKFAITFHYVQVQKYDIAIAIIVLYRCVLGIHDARLHSVVQMSDIASFTIPIFIGDRYSYR